jgi:hypothetical protein
MAFRICPGRYLADPSLWIAVASILATMRISKALDKDGKEIIPDVKFTGGLTRYHLHLLVLLAFPDSHQMRESPSHPVPFKCNIQPRSETARSLITQADTSDNYYE